MSADLENLSGILKKRNALDDEISRIIGYPAEKGHIGEFIASRVFNITLNKSATQAGHDGIFSEGNLMGKTVNVKFYGKRESILDMSVISRSTNFIPRALQRFLSLPSHVTRTQFL